MEYRKVYFLDDCLKRTNSFSTFIHDGNHIIRVVYGSVNREAVVGWVGNPIASPVVFLLFLFIFHDVADLLSHERVHYSEDEGREERGGGRE